MTLPPEFYARDTATVARELLGKRLVRRLDGVRLGGVIVETEAYYGLEDPASRAYRGRKNYNEVMWGEPGMLFVYNVHRYWMLNIIAHRAGEVGGVLIRAFEPVEGVEEMMRNRPVGRLRELTSGPGKLSVALGVARELNGLPVTLEGGEVCVLENEVDFEVGTSHRIGVTRDLDEELRFYVKGNRFVSK